MSHVVESASSRRHRRNRRTAIILVVLVALLAGAFYYAASYFNRPSSSVASGCPTGASTGQPTPAALAPGQVTVNVYNATNRAGLAASVAKDVKSRGYVVGQVANDPLKKKVTVAAELRFGPNGKQAADVAARLMTSVTPVQDTRADSTVDLVLGNDFKNLAPAPTPTATATTAAPQPC